VTDTIDIKVPDLGDFSDVEVIEILVKAGDRVAKEGGLITLETDKAVMDVPAEQDGVIAEISVKPGDRVSSGDVIGRMEAGAGDSSEASAEKENDTQKKDAQDKTMRNRTMHTKTMEKDDKSQRQRRAGRAGDSESGKENDAQNRAREEKREERDAQPAAERQHGTLPAASSAIDEAGFARAHASPSVRKLARELGVDLARVKGSGPKSRIQHDDVKAFVKSVLTGAARTGGAALPKCRASISASSARSRLNP
jgi:pyruvate dehydrogenase E2 component (dihydrolipoamide acetyltransferase)